MTTYSSQCDRTLKIFIIVSLVLTCIIGVLMHYAYEFSGKSAWVSLISPINESTWEHLKLLFFPLLIVSIPSYLILLSGKREETFSSQFFTGNLFGVLGGMFFMVVAFYTLSGVIGKHLIPIDIAIFFVSVLLEHIIFYNWLCPRRTHISTPLPVWAALMFWIILAAFFFLFTFIKPPIGLFADPLEI